MIPAYESYAGALYATAQELGCTETVARELETVDALLKQCGSYLSSPLVSTGKKTEVLRELLSGQLNGLTLEFIMLMTSRRHLRHFHAAAMMYMQLSGFAKPEVCLRIPYAPGPVMIERLKKRLVAGKLIPADSEEVQFRVVEDKQLIGGFIASCNGYQIDKSLRTTLVKLLHPKQII